MTGKTLAWVLVVRSRTDGRPQPPAINWPDRYTPVEWSDVFLHRAEAEAELAGRADWADEYALCRITEVTA